MSSRDNTASSIPAITDQILEELERKGHGLRDTAKDKDKIISDLVTHVKKQHSIIRNLNKKLHAPEQRHSSQADSFAEFIETDAHYKHLDPKTKDKLIGRLGAHLRGKQQQASTGDARDSSPKSTTYNTDRSPEAAQFKHTSSFSVEQRQEIENRIKSELLAQIKDDLRKELIDEITTKYPPHLRNQERQAEGEIPSSKTKQPTTKKTVKNTPPKKTQNDRVTTSSTRPNSTKTVKLDLNYKNSEGSLGKKPKPTKVVATENVQKISPLGSKQKSTEINTGSLDPHIKVAPPSKPIEEYSATGSVASSNLAPRLKSSPTTSSKKQSASTSPLTWPVKGAAYLEEDDEDEDEDEDEDDIDNTLDNEKLYSITDRLNDDRIHGVIDHNAPSLLEVARFHRGEIKDLAHVGLGNSYSVHVGTRKIKIASNRKNNQCQIFYSKKYFSGVIGEYSCNTSEKNSTKSLPVKNPKKSQRYTLPTDKVIFLKAGNDEYRLRVVPTRIACKVADTPVQHGKRFRHFFQYSALFHLAIILLGSIAYTLTHQETEIVEEPRFAQVELKTPPKPTPPPKPPAKVKKVPEVKDPIKKAKITKKPASVKPKPKDAGGGSKDGGNIKKRDVKSSGLLASLGTKSGKKQTLAAISSIDAVSSLNKDSAVLKVGGLAAKVQGSRIEVASGELINTSGSNTVLRSGGVEGDGHVGALETGITGNREVRGRVSATLTRTVKIKGGLSRDEVKSVIDAHMDEVVYCYEKTLLSNPRLAGKAVFEWKVLSTGRVGEVNIKSSSLRSNEIHSCIKTAVKSWQFPRPTGGSVFVSFPFIFDSVSF